ncbi:hypothetical protein DICVIV_02644 [Dictyocaulus viviparus]|uniref:Rab3-GAP regulatory subunit N-terminal domain-containing protein n=1 Tax=Dictyocaulus viviparus TaxID=29172 RepID=A0A0D8Y4T4_DICVI|nr:hypothetical protein DICVIV_02644 [Dictyocaulus viviparus]
MAFLFSLEGKLSLRNELADKVKNYLLGGDRNESHGFMKRSVSSSSNESSLQDSEKSAGVLEWESSIFPQVVSSDYIDTSPLGWLSQCCVVAYNSMDYVLLVNLQRFVLLARSTADDNELEIRFLKELDGQLLLAEQDYISCGCLFGLGTHRISEALDCLIVTLGMSNGYVVFFTDKGTLLFFEKFSESDIVSISFDQSEYSQQLTVVSSTEIIAVDPVGIHSTLLKAKTTIAKGEKTAEQLSSVLELDVDKKHELRHVLFTGIHRLSTFEQYATASMASYNETISTAVPPQYFTYMYTSNLNFLTFAWTTEEDRKKIWSEAIRYGKSFVPHFGIRSMLGISSTPRKKTILSQNTHVVTTRGILGDSRIAVGVAIEATRGLVAVVDHVARIVLVDVVNRQIVRIWKGYRDATVAWVTSSNDEQTALFLSIFAPRRGLLESGVRVGALNVDAAGVLLDGGLAPVLCGSQNVPYERNAVFVDSQGRFSKLVVPFHLSLLSRTSQDEHDQLLISKFSSSPSSNSFMDVYSSLRLQKSKRDLILLTLPYVSECTVLQGMLDNISKNDGTGPVEELLSFIRRQIYVYNKLIEYSKLEGTPLRTHELHFSDDVQRVIRNHCVLGQGMLSSLMSISDFFKTIDCKSTNCAILERNSFDDESSRFGEFVFAPILCGKIGIKEFEDTVLSNLPFDMDSLCDLFCFVFLKSKSKLGEVGFMSLCGFLEHVQENQPKILEKCEKMAFESCDMSRALILFAACSIVKRKISKCNRYENDKDKEDDDVVHGEDWEPVDHTTEHAGCIILVMHAAFLIGQMLHQPVPFTKVVNRAKAFFREQVAAFVAQEKWDTSEFDKHSSELDSMVQLRLLLPNSLNPTLTCCDVGWELMSQWFKDTLQNFHNFELAINYIEIVDDVRLRHGLLALMWQNFVLERFKATILLIEKTGRAPKERESRQQLQMPEVRIVEFLTGCHKILRMLMDDVKDAPPPSHIQQDHLIEVWLNVFCLKLYQSENFIVQIIQSHPPASLQLTSFSRDSLVELAIRQSLVNYYLVLHHYHLAIAAAVQVAEQGTEADRKLAKILSCEWNLTVDTIQITVFIDLRHLVIGIYCIRLILQMSLLNFKRIKMKGWCLKDVFEQILCFLRAGQDSAASREISSITYSEDFIKTMTRLLAARVLRLAEEQNTVLTSAHLSYLITVAGDERMRVDWPNSNWKDAVQSFNKIISCLSLEPQFLAPFIRIGGITIQYWGIHIVD